MWCKKHHVTRKIIGKQIHLVDFRFNCWTSGLFNLWFSCVVEVMIWIHETDHKNFFMLSYTFLHSDTSKQNFWCYQIVSMNFYDPSVLTNFGSWGNSPWLFSSFCFNAEKINLLVLYRWKWGHKEDITNYHTQTPHPRASSALSLPLVFFINGRSTKWRE